MAYKITYRTHDDRRPITLDAPTYERACKRVEDLTRLPWVTSIESHLCLSGTCSEYMEHNS